MNFYLQRALDTLESTTRGLSREQLLAHQAGKWSAAEIVEHLRLAFSSTARLLSKHLKAGAATAERPRLRHTLLRTLVISWGYFPTGGSAPEFTRPRGEVDPEAVLRAFRDALATMDEVLVRCEQRFGRSVPIAAHFLFGPLTVDQWRKFHWVHTRHHVKQIRRLAGGRQIVSR